MNKTATIRFWGVRGSIASPGFGTYGVGGNTSCVEINLGGQRILIDGGTGLQAFGRSQGTRPLYATMLFSHLHWDHIQGVPFFGPLYNPQSRLQVVGPAGVEAAWQSQMSGPMFPVGMEVFAADLSFEEVLPDDRFEIGPVKVITAPLNHPGGAVGFRLEYGGIALAYCADTEHLPRGVDPNLAELALGAEVLIYDAQYLPEEYPRRIGWGHSTYEKGVELALAAESRSLVLTHHDPGRDDADVMQIEQRARHLMPDAWIAREGMTFDVRSRPVDPGLFTSIVAE